MSVEELYRAGRRAAVFGITVGVGLGIAKLFGGWYGHSIALLSDSPRTATLTAKTDMLCYGMTAWDFKPLVESNADIAWKLLTAMSEKLS